MPAEKETTEAKLRRQIAELEAKADALKVKLEKLLAAKTGEKAPVTGLDLLWLAALPKSRERTTKEQCRIEWNKIPKGDRPIITDMIEALKAWNQSDEWIKDRNAYAPGLHRWIKNRGWECPPQIRQAPSRHRAVPAKPAPQTDDAEVITDRAELARFFSFKPNSPTDPQP